MARAMSASGEVGVAVRAERERVRAAGGDRHQPLVDQSRFQVVLWSLELLKTLVRNRGL